MRRPSKTSAAAQASGKALQRNRCLTDAPKLMLNPFLWQPSTRPGLPGAPRCRRAATWAGGRPAGPALARALADLGDVRAGEAVGVLDQQVLVHVGRDGRLAQHRAEDLPPARLVRQRDVDQLVQPPRPQQRAVDDVGPAQGIGYMVKFMIG